MAKTKMGCRVTRQEDSEGRFEVRRTPDDVLLGYVKAEPNNGWDSLKPDGSLLYACHDSLNRAAVAVSEWSKRQQEGTPSPWRTPPRKA